MLHCLKYIYCKNICFEAIQNGGKSACSGLEQRSVMKFLVAKQCKACEINQRIWCVREIFFLKVKRNIYKWAKRGFATLNLSWKTVHRVEMHWLTNIKNFHVKWSVKKVTLTVFYNRFLLKKAQQLSVFSYQLFR